MSFMNAEIEQEAIKALEILTREREMSLSAREWKHRLTGYGYAIRDDATGPMVTWLPKGLDLCALPERLH
jgi:hypothetical protein